MEEFIKQIDIYGVLASILAFILATVVPFLSYKYRKVLCILRECRKTLIDVKIAWKDHSISNDEVKLILDDLGSVLKEIRR